MKLIHSLSFRLAVTYAALFVLSVALLGALYYVVAIRAPLEAVRDGLREESSRFEALHRRSGPTALARALDRRAAAPAERAAYHALIDPQSRTITANLPSWPRGQGDAWIHVEADVAREGGEDESEALVHDRRLADGSRLLIGRDIEDLDERQEGIEETLIWLLPALLLLSIAGAALMSRAIGRRIDSLAATARGVIAGDLTERVPVRGSGDDFDRLGETLNLMLERIEHALEAVRRVSDSVAHELRTPLTRLRASLAELEQKGDPAAIADAVQEAERLQAIFNAVLRISRIEAARGANGLAPTDLAGILQDAVELYQPEAEDRGQRLTLDIGAGLRVAGDRDLLFQAIANLLDNAVKFAPAGGRIAVTGRVEGDRVAIFVEDDGPGIDESLRERVTERFFRTPDAEGVPGYGLGLALVSAVAAHHRSDLRMESAMPGLRVLWAFERIDHDGEA